MIMMKLHWCFSSFLVLIVAWTVVDSASLVTGKDQWSRLKRSVSSKANETDPSASYDSFRVSTPENNRHGTLLLDSYHDFRRDHHNYNYDSGHHYLGEDGYHHRHHHHRYHHHGYPGYHHHRHHHTHHYPSSNGLDDEIIPTEELPNGEVVELDQEEPNLEEDPIEPVNGELIETPEEEAMVDDIEADPAADVEEIPIEEVPGEPIDGEVSEELKYPTDDYAGTNHRHHHYSHHSPGYYGDYDHSSGRYGHHYPVYSHLPPTHFKCSHVKHSGHHSDVEARCQVILPGNRHGRWEILHFLHKSSPQKSNAVVYLDHGHHHHHHHPHYHHHHQFHHGNHHYLSGHHYRHHHHGHHNSHHFYNGHHYPREDYIK